MPSRPQRRAALLILGLLLSGVGCSKEPAEEALAEAEHALESADPDLERYAPETHAALSADLERARIALSEGRYTEALRLAQKLPGRIRRAVDEVTSRRAGEQAETLRESPVPDEPSAP